jgi:hypothetical protein
MANDIIKREIIDSEESKKSKKDIEKLLKKADRTKEKEKLQPKGEKVDEPVEAESADKTSEISETEK